jgi:nucleoside-diphosphate-sugar epimerase
MPSSERRLRKVVVTGAAGGLGSNVLRHAASAGHDVTAFVRRTARDLPAGVRVVNGDAARAHDLAVAAQGADALFFCANPRFSRWTEDFPPLVDAAIAACLQTGARLVFPANVWVYGPGRRGDLVNETRPLQPSSKLGRLRAWMEARIRESGCRYCMVRLPEFYGPNVVSLTARVFVAALKRKTAIWPGPLDADVEFVYMPDAAVAMVTAAADPGSDAAVFHIPGARTTVREFTDDMYSLAQAGRPRVVRVPIPVLKVAGVFSRTLSAVSDISHLWTHPILLDGARYAARFGPVPQTRLQVAIRDTIAWYRSNPDVVLQG